MRKFFACFFILAGCVAPVRVHEAPAPPPAVSAPSHSRREMIVYVPLTDEAAAAWPKWFVKYPNLRLVIALSPRFLRLAKDARLKEQFQALQKAGRLDIALQIPNAPILPLLVDPRYGYPDDVVQLVAQSKADFFRQWNILPRGLVLPYGAASAALLALLERLGFNWTFAALGAPAVDGPYQKGFLLVWDGAPSTAPTTTVVRVWDERDMKERPLGGWVQETEGKGGQFLLPSDAGIRPEPLSSAVLWKERTWSQPDWSSWIGNPLKNSAWEALRKTREALERYKNSGQASVQRLDAAFSEIYAAQNSNYFAAMGDTLQPPAAVEDRQHEFQATLLAVYRLIGTAPPDDLFQPTTAGNTPAIRHSSTTTRAEVLPDGREYVEIRDAVGDAVGGSGAPDLTALDVWSSSESVQWTVTLATTSTSVFADIYVDLNGQPNAGTPSLLPGRNLSAGGPGLTTAPNDAWEYAIALAGPTATLYRTQGMGTYGVVQTFPVTVQGSTLRVTIPGTILHGSPKRWGYQVLVMPGNPAAGSLVSDFIDSLQISQADLWKDISAGKRGDIPFVRIRSK